MSKRRRIETEKDLVLAFADLFDEIEPGTPEEIDAELREAGYDPEKVTARILAVVERALTNSPLNWRNRASELKEQRARRISFEAPLQDNLDTIKATIAKLLSQLGDDQKKLSPAYYRNLDEASKADLVSWLADLRYLVALEQGSMDRSEDSK